LATLFSKLIFVLLVLLFIKAPEHSPLFLFFMGIGSLLTGVVSMILVVRKWKLSLEKISGAKIFFSLKDGWPVTGTNLSMNFIQYGNLFILRLFTNDLVAGYFGVAERIFFAVKQVLTIFSQTVYPGVCQLAAAGEEQLRVFFKKIFLPFFYSIVAGSILLFFLSPFLISFFTNELNPDSVFSLRMLCIVLPVICLNLPGTLSLLAYDRKKPYFMVYFSALLICIPANIVLVQLFHSDGTIAAIFLTEIFITVTTSVFMYRLLKKKI
jgi:PST family polysaccharide transporter